MTNRTEEEILKKISDLEYELKNRPDITEERIAVLRAMITALRWTIDDLWSEK